MGYLIDRLRSKISHERVISEEVEWHSAEYQEKLVTKNSNQVLLRKLETKDAVTECMYRTIDSNSGSVEKTPFPMYSEEDGSRYLDEEKLAYYIQKMYGDGIYRVRFSDGRGFKILVTDIFVQNQR